MCHAAAAKQTADIQLLRVGEWRSEEHQSQYVDICIPNEETICRTAWCDCIKFYQSLISF